MDAASRTGVDDIRELIDGVRYRPVSARYKVYIIDEVHMLSTNAFNALLKTLEEPPAHVKFIFATTEIRKVPVTVLSRCQRFDLRRVDAETLCRAFPEDRRGRGRRRSQPARVGADRPRRRRLGARRAVAARPGDRAAPAGEIGEADGARHARPRRPRSQIFDLFDSLMRGDAKAALDLLGGMYAAGADPSVRDAGSARSHPLADPGQAGAQPSPRRPACRRPSACAARRLAEKLSIPVLARCWQMLLKGLGEVQSAPQPLQAAEMVLIRLTHVADLPPPADLVRQLQEAGGNGAAAPAPARAQRRQLRTDRCRRAQAKSPPVLALVARRGRRSSPRHGPGRRGDDGRPPASPTPAPSTAAPAADPKSFEEVVALLQERREAILYAQLHNNVHLVRFEPGRIEIRPEPQAPANLANRLGALLGEWTGRRWVVAVSSEPGDPTLAQQKRPAKPRRARRSRPIPWCRR